MFTPKAVYEKIDFVFCQKELNHIIDTRVFSKYLYKYFLKWYSFQNTLAILILLIDI